jgi:hypothetical protein
MDEFIANLLDLYQSIELSVQYNDEHFNYITALLEPGNEGALTTCGLVFFIVPIVATLIFYIRLDNPKYANISSWILALVLSSLIAGFFTAGYSFIKLTDYYSLLGKDYPFPWTFPLTVGALAFVYSAITFFVCSFIGKSFSVTQKNNPI